MSATPKEVAEWMVEELERVRFLYQEMIVHRIASKFGKDFVYTNRNGNKSIDRRVLDEFKLLTPNVVWERSQRCWQKRAKYHPKNKRQAD